MEEFRYSKIDLPVEATCSPEAAVRFLVGQLVATGQLPPQYFEETVRSVMKREQLGSTAIGKGVAVPHAGSSRVERVAGVAGCSKSAVPWETVDNVPVHVVCLILGPMDRPGDYMRALEHVARSLR